MTGRDKKRLLATILIGAALVAAAVAVAFWIRQGQRSPVDFVEFFTMSSSLLGIALAWMFLQMFLALKARIQRRFAVTGTGFVSLPQISPQRTVLMVAPLIAAVLINAIGSVQLLGAKGIASALTWLTPLLVFAPQMVVLWRQPGVKLTPADVHIRVPYGSRRIPWVALSTGGPARAGPGPRTPIIPRHLAAGHRPPRSGGRQGVSRPRVRLAPVP